MSSEDNHSPDKHKFYAVPRISITVSVAVLLFLVMILPMLITGLMIENGQLLPNKNHYLAIPVAMIFLLIPIARLVSRIVFSRYIVILNHFCEEIKQGNYDVSFSLPNQKENEDEYTVLLRNLAWVSHNLNVRHNNNMKKIRKAKQSIDKFEQLAHTDPLTGLYNRRFLEQLDNSYAKQYQDREGLDTPTSLIYIDCDKFKQVNDLKGHVYGDRLLTGIADCLKKACRQEQDLPFRMGGDEFAVLLHDTTSEQAIFVARRINAMYRKLEHAKDTTLSIGIATQLNDGQDQPLSLNHLIDTADKRAYAAKRSGGDAIIDDKYNQAEIYANS